MPSPDPRGAPQTTATRRAARVLVIDDRLEMAEMLADGLNDHGYEAVAIASSKQALARLAGTEIDAVVTDLRMPDVDGMQILAASQKSAPHRPVIMMTAFGAVETAVEAIRRGAYHYLTKPFKLEELVLFLGRALDEVRVRREAHALRTTLRERFSPDNVIGRSPPMRALLDMIGRLAATDAPVLITGETGTGKGLIARAIHAQSGRITGPFVTVNCAAVPENLLESELFGHVRGAFTGATRDRPGLFVEAESGTLFLDEVGEMSPALQSKLLDVLERSVVRPVGGSGERAVDVRIIAATHRDLPERVSAGAFREDLLYRLDVLSVHVPALRERRDDIPLLVAHFLEVAQKRHAQAVPHEFSPAALERLIDHRWPGNIRELVHVIERAVLLGKSARIDAADLPLGSHPGAPPEASFGTDVMPIRELHQRYARWALAQLGGHRGRTAERLGIDAKTLAKWLSEDE